jgi:GT2 family glycosyltransferase
MRPELSVVIVTYNSPEWTARCLDALLGEGAPSCPYEIVIVDNGSAPEAREALLGRSAVARVLLVDGNLGFGRGCNLGVAHSRGRWILLLNPDAVVRPGSIDAMLAFAADRPWHGIVGGRTLRPDGSTDPSSCWGRPTLWSLACFALGLTTLRKRSARFDPESLGRWERDTAREVGIVTGCLLLTSREVYDRLGGFDPRFFMYGEDADLSLRAVRQGWRPAITPDGVAVHAVGASSPRRADKLRLLMTGKATLAGTLWRGPARRLAIALLVAGTGLRALPERLRLPGQPLPGRRLLNRLLLNRLLLNRLLLNRLLLNRQAAEPAWLPVWRDRRRWRRGFDPPVEAPAVRVVDHRADRPAGEMLAGRERTDRSSQR